MYATSPARFNPFNPTRHEAWALGALGATAKRAASGSTLVLDPAAVACGSFPVAALQPSRGRIPANPGEKRARLTSEVRDRGRWLAEPRRLPSHEMRA